MSFSSESQRYFGHLSVPFPPIDRPHLYLAESRSSRSNNDAHKREFHVETFRATRANVCPGLLVCLLLFHDFGNAEWLNYRERYEPTFTDRGRPMLVRFPSCGDGPSKPSWSLLCAFCLSRFNAFARCLLAHYQRTNLRPKRSKKAPVMYLGT